jgi:hypothetical protein
LADTKPKWSIRSLQHALGGAAEEPPWVIEDLLLAESATLVSGHPQSLKSLAWLAAALEASARGRVWRRFKALEGSSLFIESEDPIWVIEERIRCLANGLGIKDWEEASGFRYVRTGPFDLVKSERDLANLLQDHKPNFAVVSTLQSLLSGRSWNEQDEMQAVNSVIVRLASEFCPIVLITHSPWDRRQKRAAGSVTQAANFLTAMHFEKSIDRKTDLTLVHATLTSKMGKGTDFTLRLETHGESRHREVSGIVYHGQGRPRGSKREAILAAIKEDPEASAGELGERIGVSRRYVEMVRKDSSQGDSG